MRTLSREAPHNFQTCMEKLGPPDPLRTHFLYNFNIVLFVRLFPSLSGGPHRYKHSTSAPKWRCGRHNRRARPHEWPRLGATDVTKPCNFVWFGDTGMYWCKISGPGIDDFRWDLGQISGLAGLCPRWSLPRGP